MSDGSSQPDRYEWTIGRRLVAAAMVTFLGGFASVMFWREFSEDVLAAVSEPARVDRTPLFDLSDLTVPADQLIISGVPKDGIPALFDPAVVDVDAATALLREDDRIIEVNLGGEVRGYPIRIAIWHEAINDVLGEVPIAVVYCPLCDSASVVDRRLDGRTYSFGVSGWLMNSNVVLYDRTHQALWSQIGFEAVSGPNAGRALRHLPWAITTFGAFRREHPGATVLSDETGYDRAYEMVPYQNYFASDELMFPVVREDHRLPPRTRVVGVRLGEQARAYPVAAVRRQEGGILRDELAGQPIVLKSLDAPGTVRVVEVPPDAQVAFTFWFAWAAFHDGTDVYE